MAACANTIFSSIPHLQAVHRRISAVVPVKFPSIRGAIFFPAPAESPLKRSAVTWWPVVWFGFWFDPLFSAIGRARTQAAHCASLGSVDPGGRVVKRAGATDGAMSVGRGVGEALATGRPEALGDAGIVGGPDAAVMALVGEPNGCAAVAGPAEACAEAQPPRPMTRATTTSTRVGRIAPQRYESPPPRSTASAVGVAVDRTLDRAS